MDYRENTTVTNIFLSGATGVLGARLLQEILTSTDACVYCLTREETPSAALEKIERILFVYDENRTLADETWRIIPVPGNLDRENLGMEESTYNELAEAMDLVFHCAANVSLIASYERIAPVNVEGTKRIIDFCLKGNSPLLYVSSFSVIGDQLFHETLFKEQELDVGQGFEDLDYERSKFTAEQAVHAAGDQGLNWAIVRPGNIWGDSKTGCYPLFETKVKGIYYEMIRSLVETGYSYFSTEDFDISPVDFVAEACLFVAMNIHRSNRQTYHLTNPNPVNYNDIVNMLINYGYTIRKIDDDEYFEALYEERMLRDGKPYRSTFTDLLAIVVGEDDVEEKAKFDTKNIQALLQESGIQCQPSDDSLMKTYLDYCVGRGLIQSPAKQQPLAEISKEMENKIFMQHLYDEDLELSDATT